VPIRNAGRIRGVAIKHHATGLVISLDKPARHHHIIEKLANQGWPTPIGHDGYTQGFIDDRGYFLDRKQAFEHVEAGSGLSLHSEDLW
jgi:hypothetical protein